ncbi:hypothetical protein AXG93_2931s1680 [Marchantia polymorpha subsp. ruderalis]|uniref:Uncharacterized protein n=1 Tax=Marchantia polymorpha subsp. ruderalis TaxID=1480154 RepID=A0A176VWZ7_MARPO|nr:hypothetical protein AXG93_2931s1680 [Marchantia polymorpha subsp. ruderalis]
MTQNPSAETEPAQNPPKNHKLGISTTIRSRSRSRSRSAGIQFASAPCAAAALFFYDSSDPGPQPVAPQQRIAAGGPRPSPCAVSRSNRARGGRPNLQTPSSPRVPPLHSHRGAGLRSPAVGHLSMKAKTSSFKSRRLERKEEEREAGRGAGQRVGKPSTAALMTGWLGPCLLLLLYIGPQGSCPPAAHDGRPPGPFNIRSFPPVAPGTSPGRDLAGPIFKVALSVFKACGSRLAELASPSVVAERGG